MKEYNSTKTNYQMLNSLISSYLSLKNSVKSIDEYGFTIDVKTINTQIQTQIDINLNLMKQYRKVRLSRRIDPTKDYCSLIQPICGLKETPDKKGYKEFPDGKNCLYRTAIYFSIIDGVVPQQIEPKKNEEWIVYNLKELSNLKVTPSVETNLKQITEAIQNKFKRISRKCKRVTVNKTVSNSNISSPNYKSTSDIEKEI
ncbi:26987_t:CDS:2 [Dentiscutata erythropus]|uniref:26987_t:CDS:1 n=1 Tax=Dentiscutata erythropus TaxID=1348616 RepID=A0A9N9NYK2_9GLOM|nr:26987_t:CDS:2 [Dentiscutata erythropus]